jgi:hypothetical protein
MSGPFSKLGYDKLNGFVSSLISFLVVETGTGKFIEKVKGLSIMENTIWLVRKMDFRGNLSKNITSNYVRSNSMWILLIND